MLCFGCKNTIIPNDVSILGEIAFLGSGLSNIIIPQSVTSIGSYCFGDCNMTTIILRKMEPIPVGVFFTDEELLNCTIYVPIGSKNAYKDAYYWEDAKKIVEYINFADNNVKSLCIANWDANGDGELSEEEFTTINDIGEVFRENEGIQSFSELQYFSNIEIINEKAFWGCSNLTTIVVPPNVISIGDLAFSGCTSLESIVIPKSVTEIGENLFANTGLTSIIVDTGNSKYDSRNNCNAIIETTTNKLVVGCVNTTIPEGTAIIGKLAFAYCNNTNIVIPEGVENIEELAFYSCRKLCSVTIPRTIQKIGQNAFKRCYSSQNSYLSSVIIHKKTPIVRNSYAFETPATLYVPYGCKSLYESADFWKDEFKEIVEMEPTGVEVTDISQLDNVVYVEPTEERTSTETTISFKMKNTAAIRGFQFDLVLPEGVTPVEEEGEYVYWLNADRAPKKAGGQFYHTLEVAKQADGSYRFLCGAQADKTFKGNDGEVAVLKVNIADDMQEGDYPVILKNVKLSETDISIFYLTDEVVTKLTIVTYIPGDISGDGIVDVSDYIGVANHILGNTPAGFNARAADVNNDNVIDVSDYIGIANIILTGSIYGNNNAAARLVEKDEEQNPQ